MKLVLKAFNQMQKTVASMQLNNKPYDITLYTLLFPNSLLFNVVQSLDHELPKHLQRRKLLTDFLKPHIFNHTLKYVCSLSVLNLPCNSKLYYVTLQKIGIYITLISNYSFFLHIDFIFKMKANYYQYNFH